MKKIIAAIDGLKYSGSTTEYAVYLAKRMNAHLVGILLDDFTYHSYKIYELINAQGVSEGEIQRLENKDMRTRKHAADMFEKTCREAGLNYSIHHDRSIALQELLHESIYADLLIIGGKETLTHYEETVPTRFVRDVLNEVQCPVLVVPQDFQPVNKCILLYDGSPSSVYATKTFSYIFSSFKNLDTEVLTVKHRKETLHVPDNRLMKEFMKRHFPDTAYTVLKGLPETEIVNFLKELNGDNLVVLGANSRGMVSRWFRESMSDVLMRELRLPLFITHI